MTQLAEKLDFAIKHDRRFQSGRNLRYWRKQNGLTQKELSGLLGLSVPCVGTMERGTKPIEQRTQFALKFIQSLLGPRGAVDGEQDYRDYFERALADLCWAQVDAPYRGVTYEQAERLRAVARELKALRDEICGEAN